MIIEMQKNWIGRSEGSEIDFNITKDDKTLDKISVFTTRLDTIFGCTYIVIAPENKIISKIEKEIQNMEEVGEYIKNIKNKSDLERTDLNKNKTGIKLGGIYAINPFNNEKIEVFIADYVLNSYGTGCVMAVPAHDSRDFEFAKKYNLEIRESVISEKLADKEINTDYGTTTNSGDFSNLDSKTAIEKMIEFAETKEFGRKKINFKLKDWVFSRQRYWGEPIPIIHCPKCGIVSLSEKDLPLKLPNVENYEPSGTGESPLANIDEWVNVKCPICGEDAKRETNTMPQWAGSCWYYLRYIDPKNNELLIDPEKEKYWMNVDLYVGGAEHATRHLIYARFWHKFLYDIGVVSTKEPFQKLLHVGLVMAEDGTKISKRKGNGIDPNDIVEEFGADSLRLFEMFMGPFSQSASWSRGGILGMRKFLERVYQLKDKIVEHDVEHKNLEKLANKTIKKVGEDIDNFSFNTAISSLMILSNSMKKEEKIPKDLFEKFLIILNPFAPHITEELWNEIGNKTFITKDANWPDYDKNLIKDDIIKFVISVNGKPRDVLDLNAGLNLEEVLEKANSSDKIKKYIENKEIKKTIFIENKLLNIII
jgi:leucyl-tRNA synthetase